MKLFSKIINILLVVAILFALFAAIGSTIMKEPVLLSVIRSNSMHPVWERGDMVVINNINEHDDIHIGDIVFFKTEEGSLATKGWIAHRVISGNAEEGFITKGDANERTDQELDGTGAIQKDWIVAKAMTLGSNPIVIPKVGYLALWMEETQSNPLIIPIFAVILAVIIAVGEMTSDKRGREKKKGMELQLIYILGGITISVIMGASMLFSAQKINLVYEVSEQSQGVLMGSDIGILKMGDQVTRPLSELNNQGVFPLIGVSTTNDDQIELSHEKVTLSKGQVINTHYTVTAEQPGTYESTMRVGLFYPFLPKPFIHFLAQSSFSLALIAVSIIPGIPFIIYPFINGKMRRKIMRVIRKRKWKLLSIRV